MIHIFYLAVLFYNLLQRHNIAGMAEPDRLAWTQAAVSLLSHPLKVALLDVDGGAELDGVAATLRLVGKVGDRDGTGPITAEQGDLEGLQDHHGPGGGHVQVVPHHGLQHGGVHCHLAIFTQKLGKITINK